MSKQEDIESGYGSEKQVLVEDGEAADVGAGGGAGAAGGGAGEAVPCLWGVPLKYISCVLLSSLSAVPESRLAVALWMRCGRVVVMFCVLSDSMPWRILCPVELYRRPAIPFRSSSHPIPCHPSSFRPSFRFIAVTNIPPPPPSRRLITLAVQNSALAIVMHYSRVSTPPERAYSAGTAVLMNEILKGGISLVFAFVNAGAGAPVIGSSASSLLGSTPMLGSASSPMLGSSSEKGVMGGVVRRVRKLAREVFSPDCWKLSIPAILYVIQNNLQYVAASNLDAATFQVSYQMKILTTAGFSVLLLKKKLLSTQWIALLFLAIGVGVVQIQSGCNSNSSSPGGHEGAGGGDHTTLHATKGFLAVAAACFTSGLAGVYFEMVLKNTPGDLWVRNVQLSLFSLVPCVAPILLSSARNPNPNLNAGVGVGAGLFAHFGVWAWATVAIQVFGGLVTAMVIKYSDNILKGFATSLSIVMSFMASVYLFEMRISFPFVLGSAIVLNATWLYNQQPRRIGLGGLGMGGGGQRDQRVWNAAVGWNAGPAEKASASGGGEKMGVRPGLAYRATTSTPASRVSSFVSLPPVLGLGEPVEKEKI
ncbi:hypothetical protein CYLTODRAFT_450153 [Cylindrobasidium torrendii FP15055 ss-10]|uniref:Nucleotide-sugar transporter n=1 Tax=Cylindrobasidium torrendii FP15055 ss-10 TaxID=1314674 RepID=A0A0D7BNX0_9AGAR|nr:hypothetical protein CYLTODRAFT_450153 [Cylindrobasidium torrendii FP15055 ss-10]